MPNLTQIKARLTQIAQDKSSALTTKIIEQIQAQHYRAQLSSEFVQAVCAEFGLSRIDFALHCLPIAACYALVPVSNFYVGAVAIGQSGNFYFGANQEFAREAMQQTIHAEQSAVSHAWIAGEQGLTDIVVNYTPCGHCRQFLNELNSAAHLQIHLPHSQNNLLHSYLPDAFGPKDLNVVNVLFDPQQHNLSYAGNDPLTIAAVNAANQAYAPYSQATSGIALQLAGTEEIITGRYAENAAFNPSLPPLQSALNFHRLAGFADQPIQRAVLAEKKAVLSHRWLAEDLLHSLNLSLEYISL